MLVLAHSGGGGLAPAAKGELSEQIVQRKPLAMFFTGTEAEALFGCLLTALSVPASPLPMMTNFSAGELADAVDEFLSSTWPPDERWDEWQGYLLVSVGGPVGVVKAAARPLLDG